jgi:DNA-binding protein Fis
MRKDLLKLLLDAIEKCLILKVLDKAFGNQKEAARMLGIKYTTLNQKVKKHGIRFRRGIHFIEI